MKVIIVDDEVLVRAGMRIVIPWEAVGFEIAGEATSAEEGIALARRIRPELMLVDISMPGMNGLDMIKILQEELPACDFIILTCHSEVGYLTQAIKLGVRDYILKDSLKPEEIIQTLRKVMRTRSAGRSQDSLQPEGGRAAATERALLEAMDDAAVRAGDVAARLYPDAPPADRYFAMAVTLEKCAHMASAAQVCTVLIQEHAHHVAGAHDAEKAVFLIGLTGAAESMDTIAFRCLQTLSQTFDASVAVGVSALSAPDAPCRALLDAAVSALAMRRVGGWGRCYRHSEEGEQRALRALRGLSGRRAQIGSIYQIRELEEHFLEIDGVVRGAEYMKHSTLLHALTDFAFAVNELAARSGCPGVPGFSQEEMPASLFEQGLDYAFIRQRFLEKLREIQPALRDAAVKNDPVAQIKRYVAEHATERILLQELADHVHLSRTYVSALFKRETGVNINDYIAREKLQRGKEMLLMGERVGEVAQKLGIQSESYFVQMFRRQFGETPARYTKRQRAGKP
jgi:two-component system response regulator YesN